MEQKEVEIILFGAETDQDLRVEYPELADIPEMKDLSPKEVRLCWLLGNRTSPIYRLSNKRERLLKALELVYGKHYEKHRDLQWLGSGDIPPNILKGIKRMEAFNPEYRLRAKLMSQYMFEILNEMILLDEATLAAMDIDEKKKYTDLVVKVNQELPDMIKRLETAYGVKTVEKKTKKQVLIGINDIMR